MPNVNSNLDGRVCRQLKNALIRHSAQIAPNYSASFRLTDRTSVLLFAEHQLCNYPKVILKNREFRKE